jgi:putative addiction module CopG family antidote
MPIISVELPEELQEFVDASVERGRFADASEYIVALVDAAHRKRSDLEAALLEGLSSGPADEWTSQEWSDMRQRVIQRHQQG